MAEQRDPAFSAAFDPTTPEARLYFLTQRVDALTREKERLEKELHENTARLQKIEQLFSNGVFGVDAGTLKWLMKADEEKLKRVDAAVQFMENAQFMGRWTWIGISMVTFVVGAVYGLVTWIRNIKLP